MTLGSGHKLDDRTRNRITVMVSNGQTSASIARVCGVSEKTVQRVRVHNDLTKSGDSAENSENQ